MQCPKCGAQMPDDKLYCEKCGEEINIVPDLEPEIENKIEETLSNVTFTVNDDGNTKEIVKEDIDKQLHSIFTKDTKKKHTLLIDEFSNDDLMEDAEEDDIQDDDFWDMEDGIHLGEKDDLKSFLRSFFGKGLVGRIVILLAAFLIFAGIGFGTWFMVRAIQGNSFVFQYEKAEEAAKAGNYAIAIDHLEQACMIDSSHMDAKLLLADCYYKNNRTNDAILTLKGMISGDTQKDVVTYNKLFDIYAKEGNIAEINTVLSASSNAEVREHFKQYLALAPEFSHQGGSYDDVVHLKLTGNTVGVIYYTLDGSTPDTSSMEYTSPIYLENGYYTVKAIFVNSYGLMSEVVSNQFEINVRVPEAPVVSPKSGTYNIPEVIRVTVPEGCKVYYTTDGTEPTQDSIQYTGPICMPLGNSKFSFVSYSEENIAGEVTEISYSLKLPETAVSAAAAANIITEYRYSLGGMTSTTGELSTISGKLLFMCESAVYLNGDMFFVICEYYEDTVNNIRTKTGLVYCVSMTNAEKFGTLEVDANGNFYMIDHMQ